MAFPPSSSSHCTMVNWMLWASERSGMEKSEEQSGEVSGGNGQGWSHMTRSNTEGPCCWSRLTLRP